ncbi:MAG TPA: HEPN domain-containing protein [Verrucomicrobiae bacterium]|nr:HEPN domain-containing protein [Verrucomicrobiae bacterium]
MKTETQDLINLRFTQATESLKEARLLIDQKMCRGAMDRVYFTMFYCACALLATKAFGPSRDGNVAAKLDREFVRTGLIPREIGERFKQATQLHEDAGIGSEPPPDCQRMRELMADAENFLTTTKLFVGKR